MPYERMFHTHFRRPFATIILAFAVCLVLPPQGPAMAQTITDTFSCSHVSTIDLGSVLVGGSIHDSLFLFDSNTVKPRDTINFTIFPNGTVSLEDTNPFFLSSLQQTYATTILFSPTAPGSISDSIVLESLRDASCRTTYRITAEGVGPTADNAIIPLHHTSHDIIAFKSDTVLHIQLHNNGAAITFDTLKLDTGTAFRLDLSAVTFPYTLASGSSFPLTLSFIASTPGFYTDFISAPDEPILPISVQGLLNPNDEVQTPGKSTYIWLYPNPSQSMVTIRTQGLSGTHAIITDVLGRVVQQADFTGDWQWDRQNDGAMVPAGIYFLLVTGKEMNGKAVHQVARIVLE
jgi:hypothetical protein